MPPRDPKDRSYDYALVDRFNGGDESALAELYERHRDKVYRVAFKVLRNQDDALDIVQEVFITAHRALKGFQQRAAVSTWLCQIAVHRSIDQTRKRKLVGGGVLEKLPPKVTEKAKGAKPKPSIDPIAAARTRELQSSLEEALEKLSEKQRVVFVLYSVRGLSYKEIAEEEAISIGTVMSRLFYARKKLQSMLAAYATERKPS